MRHKQFVQLIADLRAELGKSTDPAVGVADLPSLKQTLARAYETIYDDFDWPHLRRIFPKKVLNAGQQYYDFPADTDYDRVERVVVWQGNIPVPAERGIDFEEYAVFDSTQGVRADPVQKWDVRDVDGHEMLEVWPIPASNGYSIQFRGKRRFQPLVNDADLCLIDDQLVVLSAAVELAPRGKLADAQLKLAALQSRYNRMKGRAKMNSPTVRVGMGHAGTSVLTRSVVRVSGR